MKKNNNKRQNKNKQNHIVDDIFEKLNFYNIEATFSANEILYKNYDIKKVKVKLIKKKNLNIAASLKTNFVKNLKANSKINKKKITTFEMEVDSLDIEKLNDYMGYNKLSGILNISTKGNTSVQNKNSILNQLNGQLSLNTKNVAINDLNLNKLKSSILEIENINNLLELNKKAFDGKTNIENQEIFIEIKDGNLKLPETNILLDNNKIKAKGYYELVPRNIILI